MRGVLLILVATAAITPAVALAQQAFEPSPRVQNDLHLTDTMPGADGAPSLTEMTWIAIGLDALFNLGSVAAVAAVSGSVATLEVVNLPGVGTALAFLDVAMIAVQPAGQAFIVYEVGRMNPRYEPQLAWTLAGAYGGTLIAAGVVGLFALAIPGGGAALAVIGATTLVVIPSVTTALVQSATMVDRPLVAPAPPVATLRF
jgi:hypothetical protein